MPTEMELRHFERDLLFRMLKAQRLDRLPDVILELMSRMEQEDVKIVKQQITEWEESEKKNRNP
jgi:hypothetical protein